MARCVDAEDAHVKRLFDREFETVVHWRWGSLMRVLDWMVPLREHLQSLWCPDKYGKAGGQHEGGLEQPAGHMRGDVDGAVLTATVRDRKFWGYCIMLRAVEAVLQMGAWWLEQCPCHHALITDLFESRGLSRNQWSKQVAFHDLAPDRGMFNFCPLGGCRAPELAAAGGMGPLLNSLASQREGPLLETLACLSLASEDRAAIVADWNVLRLYAAHTLELKTSFWRSLPWKLAGLAHHSEAAARRVAKEILAQYNDGGPPGGHHRMSVAACGPDTLLGQQLRSFAAGTQLSDLEDLVGFARRLKFMPVVSRCIEGKHGAVNRAVRSKHCAPTTVSLAVRLPEFERRAPHSLEVTPLQGESLRGRHVGGGVPGTNAQTPAGLLRQGSHVAAVHVFLFEQQRYRVFG